MLAISTVRAPKRELDPNANAPAKLAKLNSVNPLTVFMSSPLDSKNVFIASVFSLTTFAAKIMSATQAINFQSTKRNSFGISNVRVTTI